MHKVEVIIIGAGVVGLAIARELSASLNNVLLLEKNTGFGEETSSRNSEVIHAGLYYPTNSLKAKFCVQGKGLLYQYCQNRHIPFKRLGKLLVAQDSAEISVLNNILKQAQVNGVNDLSWVSKESLAQHQPKLNIIGALSSPSTGIIDVHAYMQSLLADFELNQGQFVAQSKVLNVQPTAGGFVVTINSQGEQIKLHTRQLINSAGLHCTNLAHHIDGLSKALIPKLHWCRGHYFSYQGKSPFNELIYPVPSENGLGIHASLDIGGQLKFGPDTEYIDQLTYQVDEQLKGKFVKAIKRYYPTLDEGKLIPAYSGIRPKLQGPDEGFKDFCIQGEKEHGLTGLINLFGIDSPGLTSSLAIAKYVSELLAEKS